MRIATALIVLCLIVAAGCAQSAFRVRPQVMTPTTQFDEAEFVHAMREGGGAISGQGFLRTVGGDVKYAAGSPVYLAAVTPHVEECVGMAMATNYTQRVECDPRVRQLMRQTQADGEGEFVFERVAAGRYYVETEVTWGAPVGYFTQQQGGSVGAFVDVVDGETAKTILTR